MDWNGLRNITSIWTLTELNYVFNRLIGSCAKLDRFCSVWLCYRLVFKHYTYIGAGAYSFSPLVLTSISDTDVDGVWTTDSVVLNCEACKTTCIHDQASKSRMISWFSVTDHNYLFSSSLWQRIDNRHVDDMLDLREIGLYYTLLGPRILERQYMNILNFEWRIGTREL